MEKLQINSEEVLILAVSKIFSSPGHYKLSCKFQLENGEYKEHSIITTDMPLIDRMNDDDNVLSELAELQAAEIVIYDYLN